MQRQEDGEKVWRALPLAGRPDHRVLHEQASGMAPMPSSADDYLHLVRFMAAKVPDVMVSHVDPSRFYDQLTALPTSTSATAPSGRPDLAAPDAWTTQTMQDFRTLRATLDQWDAMLKAQRARLQQRSDFDPSAAGR